MRYLELPCDASHDEHVHKASGDYYFCDGKGEPFDEDAELHTGEIAISADLGAISPGEIASRSRRDLPHRDRELGRPRRDLPVAHRSVRARLFRGSEEWRPAADTLSMLARRVCGRACCALTHRGDEGR